MKIIEVIYNLSSGGAERFVVDLSNQLAETNDVSLFTLKTDSDIRNVFYKSDLSSKVKYTNFGIPSGYSFKSLLMLYKAIKNAKPDIVHFHIANIVIYFILPILFYRKCRYFQTEHNDATFEKNDHRLFSYIRRFLYKKQLVKICAISKYNQTTLESTFSLPSPKIIINGRHKTELSNQADLVHQEICSYKKNNDTFCFVHIGRCAEQKNQELLIKAFNIFNKDNDAILLIIGGGFDGSRGEELRQISNKNIHFLGEKTNVCDYLAYADAFCLCSIFEGMPITLIEAYCQGCIPISTPVSGCIDYIIDGKTGFITEDYSIERYVSALERFKNYHNAITQEALHAVYDKNFSIKECADKYMNWFSEAKIK